MLKIGMVLQVAVCALMMGVSPWTLANENIDDLYQQAKQQAETLEGSAYDRELGEFAVSFPGFGDSFINCLNTHPGDQNLYGVYKFSEGDDGFKVIFQRDDSFSRCVQSLLEKQDVPEPPHRPYLNPVSIEHKASSEKIAN